MRSLLERRHLADDSLRIETYESGFTNTKTGFTLSARTIYPNQIDRLGITIV